MSWFINFYQSLPFWCQLVFLTCFCIYLYQFIVFVCWKPPRAKLVFWQLVSFVLLAYVAFFVLKTFFVAEYVNIFHSPLWIRVFKLVIKPLFSQAYVFVVFVPLLEVIRRYAAHIFQPKEVKHGTGFTPGETTKKNGIEIARFDLTVIPEVIRGFSKKVTANMAIPFDRLSRTTPIIGDMGCGKTRLMFLILKAIEERYPDIPILIHDRKAEWLRTVYNKDKDLIFAPFDKRSFRWDIFADFSLHPELRHAMISADVMANNPDEKNKFFSDSAISLLKDGSQKGSIEELKEFLIQYNQIHEGKNPYVSILASAVSAVRDFAIIQQTKGNGTTMTIDDLLKHKGKIFMLNSPLCDKEQEPSFALLLSAFFMEIISLPDVPAGELRAFVLLDEALTFHMPKDIELSIYTVCRSKGLAIVPAAQRLPDRQHGESGLWSEFYNQMIIMKINNYQSCEVLSKKLGTVTYDERQESYSFGHSEKSNSKTSSKIQREHAVMRPEDFSHLKNRQLIILRDDGDYGAGVVLNSPGDQVDEPAFIYADRSKDVAEFMEGLN
jgi:hypothetical protein